MWASSWVPALGMRQVSLEPCAEQDGGCVQSQWREPYRCPNLYRRGPWAMLGNLPSDRPEFLRLLPVSQGSQAACHWFGGSVGGTKCNRLIHPGFCPEHRHQGLQTLNSLQPGHKQIPTPHPNSSLRGRGDSVSMAVSPAVGPQSHLPSSPCSVVSQLCYCWLVRTRLNICQTSAHVSCECSQQTGRKRCCPRPRCQGRPVSRSGMLPGLPGAGGTPGVSGGWPDDGRTRGSVFFLFSPEGTVLWSVNRKEVRRGQIC